MKNTFLSSLTQRSVMVWIMIIVSVIYLTSITLGFPSDERVQRIEVKPKKGALLATKPIRDFNNGELYFTGEFAMKDLTLFKRVILYPGVPETIASIFICILLLRILKRTSKEKLQEGISRDLLKMGFIFLILYIVERLQLYVLNKEILLRTNGEYEVVRNFGSFLPNTIIAVIFIAFSNIYARAFTLKKEQDLTI